MLEEALIKFSLAIEECHSSTTYAEDRALYAQDLVQVMGWIRSLRSGASNEQLIADISDSRTAKLFGDYWKKGEWADKELAALAELRSTIESSYTKLRMTPNWQTSRRQIPLDRPLVMGILNVTPDSFSDGGKYFSAEAALHRAEAMIEDGVDILDIGGESTRPGGTSVTVEEEISRTVPAIAVIAKRFDTPISIDTTKSMVVNAAIDAGAEIINDISGLRFDPDIAETAASSGSGLVLMHSRGEFASMHTQEPLDDIFADVKIGLRRALDIALSAGVQKDQIALDIGLGFGKTFEQNLALIAKLDKIIADFKDYPMLVGSSRKSFIGKLLDGAPTDTRLSGSLASAAIAVFNGASILRVHDVKETVDAIKVATAIRREKGL
ncbi:MAG: dihydropteroate synthase [Pyrinomonadaceae bacterium]